MKTEIQHLFIALTLFVTVRQAAAQFPAGPINTFFRISGPTATTITAFLADGSMVWTGATPGAIYTVQVTTTLAGGGNWVDYNQLAAGGSDNTNVIVSFNPPAGMVLIPAGVFTIGDTLDGEGDVIPTNVTVSAFYMDVNLVSSNQWAGVYAYATSQGYTFMHAGSAKAANHPRQTLGWYDCVKWSNARSQLEGLTPVYYTDAEFTQVFTNGDGGTTVYANWGVNGYRLPTEAEWEKAARGGLSGQRFPSGDIISESQANYLSGSGKPYDLGGPQIYATGAQPWTSPVGSFPANGYGLNDMAGNVFEWCWDLYAGVPYPAGSAYLGGTDPRGPVGLLIVHVLRGGGWGFSATLARCAYRFNADPDRTGSAFGFRCVRGL